MVLFFQDFYPNIDFYIPNRYKEGYGISTQGIDYAEANGCSLIIALDCGIKSIDKVDYALAKKLILLFATITYRENNCPMPQLCSILSEAIVNTLSKN
jgi:hypothetical protein